MMTEIVERALKLMGEGLLSKARRLLLSQGIGDLNKKATREEMRKKHPLREFQLPGCMPENNSAEIELDLNETYRKLNSKSGTGVDSCRNEYLKVLTQDFSDDQAKRAVESHEYVANEFVNGKLPGWYYWIAQMVNLVPLIKGPGKHRPIGMGANRSQ